MSAIEALLQAIPPEIANKLDPWVGRIPEILQVPDDWAHGNIHLMQVAIFGRWIASELDTKNSRYNPYNLTPRDYLLIQRGALLHDTGYKFKDILQPNEHHYGSALVAAYLHGDIQLAMGILGHSNNLLPPQTPDWVFILRSADRLAGISWTGLIRMAWFEGFRGPHMDHFQRKLFRHLQNPFWDLRHPLSEEIVVTTRLQYDPPQPPSLVADNTDYEQWPKDYCLKFIFPFLAKNGLVDKFIGITNQWSKWTHGMEEWEKPTSDAETPISYDEDG